MLMCCCWLWVWAGGGPADAFDAGGGCGLWLEEGQLVLMMLAVVVGSVSRRAN